MLEIVVVLFWWMAFSLPLLLCVAFNTVNGSIEVISNMIDASVISDILTEPIGKMVGIDRVGILVGCPILSSVGTCVYS